MNVKFVQTFCMSLYLLHHVQLRAFFKLPHPVTQLLQLYYQPFSSTQQLLLSFLLGLLHHLERDITIQNHFILNRIDQQDIRQKQEHYLIIEFKDMEDILWPAKDSGIQLQILRLKHVGIQEVLQSAVGFLSEHKVVVYGVSDDLRWLKYI